MKSKIAFTKKDIIVLFGCLVFLLANIGAVGISGRRRAKEAVCLSNLHQWGFIMQAYTEENDGKFWTGLGSTGYWWPWQLEERYKDWKINKILFCPIATKPIFDEQGNTVRTLNIFSAWGIFRGNQTDSLTGKTYSSGPNGIAGSYGLNSYVLNIPENSTFEGGVPATEGWRTTNVQGADNIPLFIDALRYDFWPLDNEGPAQHEFSSWSSNNMARCCINRHNGAVNCLFLDFSARKTGLKELWTLKWHRSFNTCGPWTKCGGVQPEDWPQWMREFKEFKK